MEVNSHLLVIVAKCDEQAMWMNNFLGGGGRRGSTIVSFL